MLDWGNVRVSPDGIGSRHVTNCVRQARKGMFEGKYVPGCYIRGEGWLSWVGVMGF